MQVQLTLKIDIPWIVPSWNVSTCSSSQVQLIPIPGNQNWTGHMKLQRGMFGGNWRKYACVKVSLTHDFKWQNKLNFYLFFHLYTFKFYLTQISLHYKIQWQISNYCVFLPLKCLLRPFRSITKKNLNVLTKSVFKSVS